MHDFIPGTNFFAIFNEFVSNAFTDEFGYVVFAECEGNPNIVAIDENVFVTGCHMIRKDILSGNNIYYNFGTLAVPIWGQFVASISVTTPVFGEIVAGNLNTWTLAHVPVGTIMLAANGQVLTLGVDYTIVGDIITTIAPWDVGALNASYSY